MTTQPPTLSRRGFGLQLAGAAALGLGYGLGSGFGCGSIGASSALASAGTGIPLPETRGLWLYNKNTGEHLRIAHVRRGFYDLQALARLDWLLRDHHVSKYMRIDRKLYDMMYVTQQHFGADRPLIVTSGFRTAASDRKLAETIPGVARNSLHISGKAVDFQIPECSPKTVCRYLNNLGVGGVGRYPAHIHMDAGSVRQWSNV